MSPLAGALEAALRRADIRHALAPASAAGALLAEVEGVYARGLLAPQLFEEYQGYWRFEPSGQVREPRSLIVVAWASPPVKLRFCLAEGALEVVVPPTYISAQRRRECLEAARSVLAPAGYGVEWARVPVKLLAVGTGLAQYGRNNIAYVPGLGSLARLGALCTDADLGAGDSGRSPVVTGSDMSFMAACTRCRRCSKACPTGCIPEEGTVIDASRCLTEANENEGEWPDWVPVGAHNSLVGCMRCQESCPVNRPYLRQEPATVAEFDSEETDLLMQGLPAERLPQALKARLAALDMDGYETVLGRNLRALRDTSGDSARN